VTIFILSFGLTPCGTLPHIQDYTGRGYTSRIGPAAPGYSGQRPAIKSFQP
jgi:hypothetical protein